MGSRIARSQTRPISMDSTDSVETIVARIEEEVPSVLAATNTPGASIALIHDRACVWTGGFGVTNSDRCAATTPCLHGRVGRCTATTGGPSTIHAISTGSDAWIRSAHWRRPKRESVRLAEVRSGEGVGPRVCETQLLSSNITNGAGHQLAADTKIKFFTDRLDGSDASRSTV